MSNKKLCSWCENKPAISKALCKACYSRMYRTTPAGKLGMNKYNSTKGKAARERYIKSKPPKPPKPPKPNCECGAPSAVKGVCRKCYYREYNRKKHGFKPGRIPKPKQEISPVVFDAILKMIQQGLTIVAACKAIDFDRDYLYKNMTAKQRRELSFYKAIKFIESSEDEISFNL